MGFFNFPKRILGTKSTCKIPPRRVRPELECLESRLAPANLTIGSSMLFTALDGSASDDDATVNGILTVNGNLTIQNGGSINANDPGAPPNNSATPAIKIVVSGDLIIEADTTAGDNLTSSTNTGIFAENRVSGGSGADITLTVGGDMTLESGAYISSSRTTSGGSGGAGSININATGAIDLKTGSVVRADNPNGFGGAVNMTTQVGDIDIDGTVSSGQKTTGGNTASHGGLITIIAGAKDNNGSDLTV